MYPVAVKLRPMTTAEGTPTKAVAKATQAAEEADDALVRRAAKEIQGILAQTVQRGLEEVGAYILEHFYGGDLELYRSTSPAKHASLTKLIERCDTLEFPVSKTLLSNAVRVAATARSLPNGSKFRALPMSHQVELARIADPEKVERLAERAAKQELPVRKLRAIVSKSVASKGAKPGRKPTPDLVRNVVKAVALLKAEDSWRLGFKKEDVEALSEEQLAELTESAKRLTDLAAKLAKLLPE